MGEAGRRRAIERFAWPAIASRDRRALPRPRGARALIAWRSPAALLEHGFGRSRLVLMNEAHHGPSRCVRTREVGLALVPVADRLGVRHLAMEALWPAVAESANATRRLEEGLPGYLGQPEMRELVNAALDLGWMLHAYEAAPDAAPFGDWRSQEAVNWREDQQARNLGAAVRGLRATARILCWCGGGHLHRRPYEVEWHEGEARVWIPMGSLVAGYGGVEPFAIDQNVTVAFGGHERPWLQHYAEALRERGGTAGVLAADLPREIADYPDVRTADAYVLSLDNALVG